MRDVTLLTTRQVPRRLGLADKVGRELTFSPEQESRLLAFASQPLADVFVILLDTGMRPEEVYRLQWEDVDWAGNVLHVHRGKTKATRRVIGMSTRVADVLRARLRRQMGVKKYAESLWVFPSRRKKHGELTHIATVNKAFADARRKVQLPQNLVLYATRHSFGTDVMGATGSAKLTMKSMGAR